MFHRLGIRRPRNLDVGRDDETVALKHRVGQEIRSALIDFKNQALRVVDPRGGRGPRCQGLGRARRGHRPWSIKPGEEEMPELIEPRRKRRPIGSARPARVAVPTGRPGGPGRPGGFGPGQFPPGPPMGMSSDIVEQMERDYQAMRQSYGDKTAAILVTGLPMGGDSVHAARSWRRSPGGSRSSRRRPPR